MSLLSMFRKKKPKKIKEKLNIHLLNNGINIDGKLSHEDMYVTELTLFNRENPEHKIIIDKQKPSNLFKFTFNLEKTRQYFMFSNETDYYDWYIKIKTRHEYLPARIEQLGEYTIDNEQGTVSYYERLGRFQQTNMNVLKPMLVNDHKVECYITKNGNLSLVINRESTSIPKIQVDKFKKRKNKIKLEGQIHSGTFKIEKIKLLTNGRNFDNSIITTDVKIQHVINYSLKKYGLNKYVYEVDINIDKLYKADVLQEDIYDLSFLIKFYNNEDYLTYRIGRPTRSAKLLTREISYEKNKDAYILNPYYTFKQQNISLEVYHYGEDTFKYLRNMLRYAWLIRLMNKHKKVWLVGERTYKAQDTGYAFFKYMRENHPDKNVYYVIERESDEKKNVDPFGNVLIYKSKEHIYHTIIAEKVISSHHPDYLYPIRTPKFKKKIRADKVFLQHGVMGTKNMVANYGKNALGFDTDLFLVSSDFERKMIVNDFGYDSKDVFVTGLSRFDSLFKKDIVKKRQVLIIPTWRDWIITDEIFFESEYYENYKSLINNQGLLQLSEIYDFDVLFCLHPNMQKYSEYFENENVKVIYQGEVDVQQLIKESAMMITDYSSVAFDFSFLHKPIIYYQFDRERFIGSRPSHLDLDNDLPGDIVFKEDELIQKIEQVVKSNFIMKDEYKVRANKFIKYKDQLSSERIYEVIKSNKVKRTIEDNANYVLIKEAIYNKFRKSKYYFPTMKFVYNIGRRIIPVDDKLIVFESGVAQHLGDSPKNIYDEIVEQKLDYKKVWIYNKQHRFLDNNTIVVRRLTPQYYYYLLRAKYWVNNQNFPTYIKKRKETTYLQTWHGTPLKKMLFDIDEVHGRSEDYVERVGQQIKNWDYLISPSEYASKAFRSAFNYEKEILEVGYPRNDIFYSNELEETKKQVINRLQIPKNKKVILYAPTFRDNQTSGMNQFKFDMNLDLHQMKQQLGDEYIILLRMHVVIKGKLNIEEELEDFVYNVSHYPDMQELLTVTDVLITDYSSVMFDFANTNKPMIFYTYDLAEYRDNIRGFYMDFEKEAPGPLVFDTNELIESVNDINKNMQKYEEKYLKFKAKYCPLEDGNASRRVVKEIFK